jgi:hypothetical protein
MLVNLWWAVLSRDLRYCIAVDAEAFPEKFNIAMPSIFLVKFRQGPLGGASAHWGLFLAHPKSTTDRFGTPHLGSLFHANTDDNYFNTNEQSMTHFHHWRSFKLAGCQKLLRCTKLDGTEVTEPELSSACQAVTFERHFDHITENCQKWVWEVLNHLVAAECISDEVFKQMNKEGYVPLGETRCGKCVKSSLSLKCSCHKNTG